MPFHTDVMFASGAMESLAEFTEVPFMLFCGQFVHSALCLVFFDTF